MRCAYSLHHLMELAMTNHSHIQAIRDAAAKLLAFADKAEKISIYNVDGSDLRRVGKDLGYIAAEIVDPLIHSYGEYVCENSHGIDIDLFKSQCHDALDGMALYEIADAADRMREDLMQAAE